MEMPRVPQGGLAPVLVSGEHQKDPHMSSPSMPGPLGSQLSLGSIPALATQQLAPVLFSPAAHEGKGHLKG